MDGAVDIPDKVFFRIGEVARITGVKTHVLRYWESEFRSLRPKKSPSGQRRYRRSDVDLVLELKALLWDRKFTHDGARAELRRSRREGTSVEDGAAVATSVASGAQTPATPEAPAGPDPATLAALESNHATLQSLAHELDELRAFVQSFGGPA